MLRPQAKTANKYRYLVFAFPYSIKRERETLHVSDKEEMARAPLLVQEGKPRAEMTIETRERDGKMATKRKLHKPTYDGKKKVIRQVTKPNKYPKSWWKLRHKFLKANPFCAKCGNKAEQVDHVIPLTVAPERVLDWYNLQSLCWPCHKAKSKAERFGDRRPGYLKPF